MCKQGKSVCIHRKYMGMNLKIDEASQKCKHHTVKIIYMSRLNNE